MPSFYVIRGKDNGQHFPLRGALVSIGRDASNQIQLHDTEVSRHHARMEIHAPGETRLIDLSSSNGTFVNGKKVAQQTLRTGDRVQLGRTLMIFTGDAEPPAVETEQPVDIVSHDQVSELSQIRRSLPTAEHLEERVEVVPDPAEDSAASRWEIVYQIGQAISRTVDLDDLLRQVIELIFQRIACDRACILMLDDVTGHLTPAHSRLRRTGKNRESRPRLEISRTILDYVVSRKEGVMTSNAQDDSRWDRVQSIVNLGVHEAICVPMLGRYGLVGAIYVDTMTAAGDALGRSQATAFTDDHLKLLIAIASQAALAVEDTQFYRAMLQSERLAAMGQTIANLSHHVKNILQGVRGGSYLIQEGLKKEDFQVVRRGWSIVERNQDRISNLVMDMLSFSKEREPELVDGDLRRTVSEVVELMQVRATEGNVVLSWLPPDSFPNVKYDAEGIHRAILNVVTNAIDATIGKEAGKVELSVRLDFARRQVLIAVSDNGEGIPAEDHERIFSPFESKKGSRGTGLGLPVSRKILREHGGDISVESVPGQGTTFHLYWPWQAADNEMPTIAG